MKRQEQERLIKTIVGMDDFSKGYAIGFAAGYMCFPAQNKVKSNACAVKHIRQQSTMANTNKKEESK